MRGSDLEAFLTGERSGMEFQARIQGEVRAWTAKLSERGRSAPITLLGPTRGFEVTPAAAMRLLDALIGSELSGPAFAYVLDALLMSDAYRWTSEPVRESLEAVLSVEAECEIDMGRAWKARRELGELDWK